MNVAIESKDRRMDHEIKAKADKGTLVCKQMRTENHWNDRKGWKKDIRMKGGLIDFGMEAKADKGKWNGSKDGQRNIGMKVKAHKGTMELKQRRTKGQWNESKDGQGDIGMKAKTDKGKIG